MPDNDKPQRVDIPEDITGLNRDELAALETTLTERFDALREADATDDNTDEMAAIADALPTVGERIAAIDAQAAKRADAEAKVTKLRDDRAKAEQEAADKAAADKAEADAKAEQDTADRTEATQVPDTDTAADAPQVEAMAAGRTVGDIADEQGAPDAPANGVSRQEWFKHLTAAADIRGIEAGAAFQSAGAITSAVLARTDAVAKVPQGRQSAHLASVTFEDLPRDQQVTRATGAHETTRRMVEAVAEWRENRQRDAITAAGWCAPSETIWDLCEPEVADQLISLPSIPITRGGIEYFPTPDFSDFDDYVWEFTEPELIAGVQKPCPEIPCPTPIEQRAGVFGACITADIVSTHGFPEWTERYVRGVLVKHAVRLSASTLEKMVAGSTPVDYLEALLTGNGFTATLLNTIEAQGEDLRADYLLGVGDTIEVILPRWVKGAIRADLVNRTGVDMIKITDAWIDGLFADRGASVQFVKGWQTNHFGQAGAQQAYPETVRFLIYRQGAWVRGLEPVLELNTLYDAQLLQSNKFVRLFTEQGLLVANLCTNSRVVEVPVCPSGSTNAGTQIACFSEDPVTPPTPLPDVPPAGVLTVTPAAAAVVDGATTNLAASYTPTGGAADDVTAEAVWTTSDGAVATVAAGVVTGVSPGVATITATHLGVSDTSQITVTA